MDEENIHSYLHGACSGDDDDDDESRRTRLGAGSESIVLSDSALRLSILAEMLGKKHWVLGIGSRESNDSSRRGLLASPAW